jgi:hypothetical protein
MTYKNQPNSALEGGGEAFLDIVCEYQSHALAVRTKNHPETTASLTDLCTIDLNELMRYKTPQQIDGAMDRSETE